MYSVKLIAAAQSVKRRRNRKKEASRLMKKVGSMSQSIWHSQQEGGSEAAP